MSDAKKVQVFSGLLEKEALLWFLETKFGSWLELKPEFIQTWCFMMTSTNAIVEVAKEVQKEHEQFCIYASKFKGYCQF